MPLGVVGWGNKMRLMDINARGLSGLKYRLVCCFKLALDVVGGSVWGYVYDIDRPAFLKRELVGFGVDMYQWLKFMIIQVDLCLIMRFESIRPLSPI